MDTPTHGLVGRLVARSLWPGPEARGLVNLVTVASVLPDLDVFVPGDSLERLQIHRGITHSLVGAVVGSLLVAWVARRFGLRKVPFPVVYLVSLTGILLHILFDLVTSYGTMIFEPFSNYRAAFDVLFIIDPYLVLILVGGLLLGRRILSNRAVGYRVGAAALAAYMALNVAVSGASLIRLNRWATARGLKVDSVAAFPVPLSPLHRRGMILSGATVYDAPVTLFAGLGEAVDTYPSALSDARLSDVWEQREGRIYRWFSRFPIVVDDEDGDQGDVLIQDLRFKLRPDGLGWLGSLVLRAAVDHNPRFFKRPSFSLAVRLNGENGLERVVYRGGGRAEREEPAQEPALK